MSFQILKVIYAILTKNIDLLKRLSKNIFFLV